MTWGGGGARAGPAADDDPSFWTCGTAQRSWAGSGPLPRAWTQLPVDCVLLLGGVAGAAAAGLRRMQRRQWGLQSGASLIGFRVDVRSLQPSSSSLTVTGCRLGGFPVRRDQWGGERVVGGVLPHITLTHGVCVLVYV